MKQYTSTKYQLVPVNVKELLTMRTADCRIRNANAMPNRWFFNS